MGFNNKIKHIFVLLLNELGGDVFNPVQGTISTCDYVKNTNQSISRHQCIKLHSNQYKLFKLKNMLYLYEENKSYLILSN